MRFEMVALSVCLASLMGTTPAHAAAPSALGVPALPAVTELQLDGNNALAVRLAAHLPVWRETFTRLGTETVKGALFASFGGPLLATCQERMVTMGRAAPRVRLVSCTIGAPPADVSDLAQVDTLTLLGWLAETPAVP